MSPSNKVLVLGAAGMLGSHVVRELQGRGSFEVVAHSTPRFERDEDLEGLLEAVGASSVINCLVYKGPEIRRLNLVNGWFPHLIESHCSGKGAFFLQISTNVVFPASRDRRWLPGDPIGPSTPYEISKAAGEQPGAYLLRTSFLGRSPKREGILERLLSGEPYRDRPWNGVTADTLAVRIADLVQRYDSMHRGGVEHVHAPEPTTIGHLAEFLGSSSPCEGEGEDGRLLGGGFPLPPIDDQLRTYVRKCDN